MRSLGKAGHMSPESEAMLEAPTRAKRAQTREAPPLSRGQRMQQATGASAPPLRPDSSMPPPPPRSAWTSGSGWIGRKQQGAAAAAASTTPSRKDSSKETQWTSTSQR